MKQLFILLGIVLLSFVSRGQESAQTIHLNPGMLTVSDGTDVPYFAFNWTNEFSLDVATVAINPSETLLLTVVNNDDSEHGFTLDGSSTAPQIIAPADSATFELLPGGQSIHYFYDHSDSPTNKYLGLGGMVVVTGESDANFYWNLRTHEAAVNVALDAEETIDWSAYYPDYYTINNLSFPAISIDPMANLTGEVGDVLHIYMINTGISMHSMHFHGYHCTILHSSRSPQSVGWSKDTFPLRPGDGMIIELIPNQPGIYPVHDHNLTAVSGGGIYLNGGALIMIDIQ
jgi:FtsP/CotA-like multicopper oxidase with cupredoxin domain